MDVKTRKSASKSRTAIVLLAATAAAVTLTSCQTVSEPNIPRGYAPAAAVTAPAAVVAAPTGS